MELSRVLLISGSTSVIACIGFAIKNYLSQQKKAKLIRDFYEPKLKLFVKIVKKIILFENDLMSLELGRYEGEWMHKTLFNKLEDKFKLATPHLCIKSMEDVIKGFAFYCAMLEDSPSYQLENCSNYESAKSIMESVKYWVKPFSKNEKKLFNDLQYQVRKARSQLEWTLITGVGEALKEHMKQEYIEMIEKRNKNNED